MYNTHDEYDRAYPIPFLLQKLKENYNYSFAKISEETNITKATLTNWMKKNTFPNLINAEKIWNLFYRIWIPGIIKFSPDDYWEDGCYIRVDDIRNPYDTWYVNDYMWYNSDAFYKHLEELEKKSAIPEIIKTYASRQEFLNKAVADEVNFNITNHYLGMMPASKLINLIQEGNIDVSCFNFDMIREALKNERGKISQ